MEPSNDAICTVSSLNSLEVSLFSHALVRSTFSALLYVYIWWAFVLQIVFVYLFSRRQVMMTHQ